MHNDFWPAKRLACVLFNFPIQAVKFHSVAMTVLSHGSLLADRVFGNPVDNEGHLLVYGILQTGKNRR